MALAIRRDPLVFELIKNALAGIADGMAVTVMRTARSFVVKQSMDFSTALLDPNGELIAQGMCSPLHLGSMPSAFAGVLGRYEGRFEPGGICVVNEPYSGGRHLRELFLVYLADLLYYTERFTRAEISAIPDGTYTFTEANDDDGIDPGPITIELALTIEGDTITADFTGTSPQCKGSIQPNLSATKAMVY